MNKKLFKSEIHIKSHQGLGINQDRTIYVVAENQVEASTWLQSKFKDSEVKAIEKIDGDVTIAGKK